MIVHYLSKIFKKARLSSVLNSEIDRTAKIESGTSVVNSMLGRYSFCGYDCTILNTEIGSFCSLASNVKIGGVAHPMHFVSTSPVFLSHRDSVKAKFAGHEFLPQIKTTIGHDVWIGENALVKAGVTIGTGAIIGMGSVVTRNVEPYAIVAGNPARLLRKRFSDEVIQSLLDTKWWNKGDSDLKRIGQYINAPEKFLLEAFRK